MAKFGTFLFSLLGDGVSLQAKTADSLPVLLVFGGMDTQGEIFNDCLVLMPENRTSIK